MSARDVSAGMLRPGAANYNLNAQAMDATVELIHGVVEERGVDVKEVYIDTIGNPQTYQKKLERIFPALKITVAKKADSLYPCVSAASVCAKVTRDAALDVCYYEMVRNWKKPGQDVVEGWGSGYPSDPKCVGWLRKDMDSLFGWGIECRFSWGTAKEMLESKGALKVDWVTDEDYVETPLTDFFSVAAAGCSGEGEELRNWYGERLRGIMK
jgi:ribonuclease H2 subunit A